MYILAEATYIYKVQKMYIHIEAKDEKISLEKPSNNVAV